MIKGSQAYMDAVARDNATIDRHDLVWVETEARRRMASVPGRADAANAETTGE